MDIQHILTRPDWVSFLELSIVVANRIEVNLVVAHVFWQIVSCLDLLGHMVSHHTRVILLHPVLLCFPEGPHKLPIKLLEIELILRLIRTTVKHGSA